MEPERQPGVQRPIRMAGEPATVANLERGKRMKSVPRLIGSVLLFACCNTQGLTQTSEVRRPALPLPPPIAATEAAGSNLKFELDKSPEENARTLKSITEKLTAA